MMSNYEKITSSPESLALWLRAGLDCEMCPCEYWCMDMCLTEPIGCYEVILDWLMREVKDDEV